MKVYKNTDHEFYMDGFLNSALDRALEVIKEDWDMVFVIDGFEGTGKSILTFQMAKKCDETFCLDRVVFTPSDFEKTVLNAKKYQAIVYDEAFGGLNSRATMSFINRNIIKMLTEIRQRNLFIFIVLPTIFDLDKYVAIWRSRALIHVYDDNFKRGFFGFYNKDKKKQLYMNGKKYYTYSKPRPNFIGRFTSYIPFDKKKYVEKKLKDTSRRESLTLNVIKIAREIKREITSNVKEFTDLNNRQIAKILDVSNQTITNYLKEYQIKEKMGEVPPQG